MARRHNFDPAEYAAHAAFVPALGAAVLGLLAPKPGERILDLGCGDGVLTLKLVEAGASVLGTDADPAMVAAARAKGLDAEVMDGQRLSFEGGFDAVFSNAALHWMPDTAAVFAGVHRALKPGGRFVAECGGFGNIAAIRAGLRGVLKARGYAVPDHEDQVYMTAPQARAALEAAGFAVRSCDIIPRQTPLASGLAAWLTTFRTGFLDALEVADRDRQAVIDETVALLRPILCDADGNWMADYVRLRFAATKPE
ncbi:class I SAM-dependent methyltransferase [Sphingosinicella microcystinivorans]|uniref:class I SAM-dependent methyltransferase n=1 Tax=Sphingosinicella microcystinivorans TaxID=335406 RepID=UPI0022F3FBEF|nr:class I SAM-dependent methyltransferase [Sphingosinicella microcystinivorans]WBX85912.1 class I SAM-dependent methyltransferase [Sphingosinicella microcystinivorans]